MFCTSRRLIRPKRTVTYHGQYFTINSRISECDHKCETRNAEPEIGTDGSSQTRRNLRVDGYGSGFGPPRVCGLGFWPVLEPNRPVVAVQTRTTGGLPGPVANTIDAIVLLYIGFIVRCAILFTVNWIIQVAFPVQPIIGVRNAFRCAVLRAFVWMTVDSSDSADI